MKKVYLLSDNKQKLSSGFENGDLLIDLPSSAPDPVNTVIIIETLGKPEVTSNYPSLKDGKIVLRADFADIHNPGYGIHAKLEGIGESAIVTNWFDPGARLEWMLRSNEAGTYKVNAVLKVGEPSKLEMFFGGEFLEADIQATGGEFTQVELGEIEVSETGDLKFEVRPYQPSWKAIELSKIELVKK